MATCRNVFVLGLSDSGSLNVSVDAPVTVRKIKIQIQRRTYVDWTLFSLSRGGVILKDNDVIGDEHTTVLHTHPLLRGGKGGFGSLIRAMGSQINKSTNKEACRNLSGRRMRDVNAEKKLAKWAADEPERKRKEAEEKRERLERKRAGPKHTFDDRDYMEQIKTTEEGMGGALKQGLEASSSVTGKGKSKALEADRPCKKPKLWLGVDEEELSDSDSEGEEWVDPSNQVADEKTGTVSSQEIPDKGTSAEPCCSSSVDTSRSLEERNGSDSAGIKTEGVISADDKEYPPLDKEDKSSQVDSEPIDLEVYDSPEQLLGVGGERLKVTLTALGLKCGGTPLDRAKRLFLTKGKTREEIDPSLFVKQKRIKRKQK